MTGLLYSKSAPPLYAQIYKELKQKISDGVYAEGEIIPTEFELQEHYGVSRITVRQAVSALEQEGLVVRTRGKGTIVAKMQVVEELVSEIKSFTDEMKDRGMTPGTKSAVIKKVFADKKLAHAFNCEIGEQFYCITRVRTANSKPMVLFETYIPTKYDLPMDNKKYLGSLYALMNECGIKTPVGIKEWFEAVTATDKLADELEINVGAPIMKRTRISYNRNVEPVEYTVCYYNSSSYIYSVRLGVTEKNTLTNHRSDKTWALSLMLK